MSEYREVTMSHEIVRQSSAELCVFWWAQSCFWLQSYQLLLTQNTFYSHIYQILKYFSWKKIVLH